MKRGYLIKELEKLGCILITNCTNRRIPRKIAWFAIKVTLLKSGRKFSHGLNTDKHGFFKIIRENPCLIRG
jgi:hypothetical protein